jgi:hypothetical protein
VTNERDWPDLPKLEALRPFMEWAEREQFNPAAVAGVAIRLATDLSREHRGVTVKAELRTLAEAAAALRAADTALAGVTHAGAVMTSALVYDRRAGTRTLELLHREIYRLPGRVTPLQAAAAALDDAAERLRAEAAGPGRAALYTRLHGSARGNLARDCATLLRVSGRRVDVPAVLDLMEAAWRVATGKQGDRHLLSRFAAEAAEAADRDDIATLSE